MHVYKITCTFEHTYLSRVTYHRTPNTTRAHLDIRDRSNRPVRRLTSEGGHVGARVALRALANIVDLRLVETMVLLREQIQDQRAACVLVWPKNTKHETRSF